MLRTLLFAIILAISPVAAAEKPSSGLAAHTADVIFLIDGSGSVSSPAFQIQLEAIRNCVCAPGAPMRVDGSIAVGVAQFSNSARIDIPLTLLDSLETADTFCLLVSSIVQMNGSTRIIPGLQVVESMFAGADAGTDRSLVILSDTVVFDSSLPQVESRCRNLRTADDPVRICAGMTDDGFRRIELFRNICNTPGAMTFDPGQPIGVLSPVGFVSQFQPICADCVSFCVQVGGPDCDGDGVPDDCEPDCNGNGVPDDCDLIDMPDADLNGNGVLDVCEDDCNENGIADFLDIESGFSGDCNVNGLPDECEGAQDCNGNGVPDFCDLSDGTSGDCNINGVPDECEQSLFGVVTHRTIAIEGEGPPLPGPTRDYGVLALGVAIDEHARVWYGDVGVNDDPTLGVEQRQGRVIEYDLVTDKHELLLRENDLVPGAEIWLAEPPDDCGEIESFLHRLPSDVPTLFDTDGDGAIRGVADDGALLVRAEIRVESALCSDLEDRGALLRVGGAVVERLHREGLDVCLLDDGFVAGPARVRRTGTFAQPLFEFSDSAVAWLVSESDGGQCVVVRDGEPSPDGGVYETPIFFPGVFSPYQTVARHAGAGQTLFYAETTVSRAVLVLDEDGVQTLIARDGTPSNLPGDPSAPVELFYSREEGCDVGGLRGSGPDVVFRAEVDGDEALFLWERESNPIGDPESAVIRPIVLGADIEMLPRVHAEPGSVRFTHPMIGGPCGSCVGQPGVVVFKAWWDDADDSEARAGLFVLVPGEGVIPVALPGQALPAPHEHLAYVDDGAMLEHFDIDVNRSGQIVYGAIVGLPGDGGDGAEPLSGVFMASVKPGRCDVAPPFGLLDLGDITRFAGGLLSGDPVADFAEPLGVYDLADIVGFIVCFTGGCP